VTDFNLRQLVRDVLAASSSTDPHQIADEVLDAIEPENYRTALAEVLPVFVRELNRVNRNGMPTLPQAPATSTLTAPRTLKAVAASTPALQEKPATAAPARPIVRSAKVAAYQDMGLRWLDTRLNTGSDPREWKRIGDCTFADLMFAAHDRREQARKTLAKAQQYQNLAELLQFHNVQRVRDLPADVLRGINGGAAA
jgi:hypothetical protein